MFRTLHETYQTVQYMEGDMPEVDLSDKEKKEWQKLSYLVKFSQVFEDNIKERPERRLHALNFVIHWAAVISFLLFDFDDYIHRLEKSLSNPYSEQKTIIEMKEKPKRTSSLETEQIQREDTLMRHRR